MPLELRYDKASVTGLSKPETSMAVCSLSSWVLNLLGYIILRADMGTIANLYAFRGNMFKNSVRPKSDSRDDITRRYTCRSCGDYPPASEYCGYEDQSKFTRLTEPLMIVRQSTRMRGDRDYRPILSLLCA